MDIFRCAVAVFSLGLIQSIVADDLLPYLDQSKSADVRVEDLLARLKPEEKIELIAGIDSMHTRPIERLGIPRFNMSDGPVGVHNYGLTTVYPAGICLAATWDPDLAKREGISLGRDARARNVHVHLAPGVNIYRVPQNGRNFEYFGEDPHLASQIAKNYITGEQSQGVISTIKHFACNNQETERGTISVQIDERTLREIYLPVFETAVKEANVRAVMSSYNKINGVWSSHNNWLLNELLKKEWGFTGVVMSDWGAVHDALGAATGGCDLEMPGPDFMNANNLEPLMKEGKVTQAMIDEKIRRIFRVMIEMGFLDRPQLRPEIPRDDPSSAITALNVARNGIVLLKNDRKLLPLDRSKVKKIVVTGPNAHPPVFCGGGSAFSDPFKAKSVLEGLTFAAGDAVKVEFVPTLSLDDLGFLAERSSFVGDALQAEYFANEKLEGTPALTRSDARINFDWGSNGPGSNLPKNKFSVRWRGKIRANKTADYRFFVRSDDGSRVKLDGKMIIDFWSDHSMETRDALVKLDAGKTYDVEIEFYDVKGSAGIQFAWCDAAPTYTQEQLDAIKSADAVIACVGFSARTESEGFDRTYELPKGQAEDLNRFCDLNKNVIVVLNSGGGVEMNPWIDRVPALLHAWYPGQEGGTAIAEIVFGDVNPSGKLPISIEKKLEDTPGYGHFPGKDGKVDYPEGLLVGYRWYDTKKIAPRFPFGFGLSYTTFELNDLQLQRESGATSVSLTVHNAGTRAGSETVQVYVHAPGKSVVRPDQELKGFAKISVPPGETKEFKLKIPDSSLRYWDVSSHGWKLEPGEYELRVGTNSRDLPFRGIVKIKG
jgi:beta-glucosidase